MACASPSSPEPETPLIRLIHQPIGRPIVVGDTLIIRGVLQKCPAWRGRILNTVTVTDDGPVRVLYAIDISPIGMWPADVRDSILRFYAEVQPNGPIPRVTVEVLGSAESDADIWKEAATSLWAVYAGVCPGAPPDPPDWWSGGDPVQSCAERSELACLRSMDCTLHQDDSGSYVCRPAESNCELGFTQVDGTAEQCEKSDGCRFIPGKCYCSPHLLCRCGGGTPPSCRPS